MTEREQKIQEFVNWADQFVSGDEKGEAQVFLDRLFQAFGHSGLREAGATLEFRVKRSSRKGTAFADLVWKPYVLIEMKRRGTPLADHYRQAFDYWVQLVPQRPRYVILCNFDEFWVFDFETQLDTPVDTICLDQLSTRYGGLAFMFAKRERPIFGNDHEVVTREAADLLATLFNSLCDRGFDNPIAQRFTLQCLVCLFAEDIGLLNRYQFAHLLDDCGEGSDAYDLLGGLFAAMNAEGKTPGGRYKGVPYFDGGLFQVPAEVELETDELDLLRNAARFDWSRVRPEIFGTLFEHSLGMVERRAFGQHFTTPSDIMKIVEPTITRPWRRAIEEARNVGELRSLAERMNRFRVLDPACGSGNFLYIAYRELKRLEARLFERLAEKSKRIDPNQRPFGFVTAHNFFGFDVNPFAVELAKVTMTIARQLAIDELHVTEHALPFDNLDSNIQAADALLTNERNPRQWPAVDVIIGNPPFGGAKWLIPQRGQEYADAVRAAYPDIPGMADYCVYWFRKAHDTLRTCTQEDRFCGRAGLVGTQNIRNTGSRKASLDYICQDGAIVEAVENQPWSGEANVHVSIVNWVKTHESALLPDIRLLWFVTETDYSKRAIEKTNRGPHHLYDLDVRRLREIKPTLSVDTDVSAANVLRCNKDPHCVFQGITPGCSGLVLKRSEGERMIAAGPGNAAVVLPYMIGRELMAGDRRPRRYVIDLNGLTDVNELDRFPAVKDHVVATVLPEVQRKYQESMEAGSKIATARREHLQRWWTFWARRDALRRWMSNKHRIVACSRVQRWPFVFDFISTEIAPGDKLQLFAFDDDYSFGILQSRPHCLWYKTKAARLKNEQDYNYSSRHVFDTFPWPQRPTREQFDEVAAAGRRLREIRFELLEASGVGFRNMYRSFDLPGLNRLRDAHQDLDNAVLATYGFDDTDVLGQLLELNAQVFEACDRGEPVTSPGLPIDLEDRGALLSCDAVRSEVA